MEISQLLDYPTGNTFASFVPGLLVLMGMFSSAFAGFSLIADLRGGLVERLRVTPVSRIAPLFGRTLRDVTVILLQSIILLVLAWILGLRANLIGVIITLGLLIIFDIFMSAASYGIALNMKNENAFASVTNSLTLPLLLLSGIVLPLTLAPNWLRTIAIINPLKHTVDAARLLFAGQFNDAIVFRGFVIIGLLACLALWWTGRSFRDAIA